MISKLSAQGSNQERTFKSKIYHEKGEDKVEIIITKVGIKVDTDQTVNIDTVEHHIQVYLSTDKITEEILEKPKTTDI